MDISKLKHFALFAKVIECGSFAEAARQLQTSRSRVSEQIFQLEQTLGVRLLHRSTRQLSVSDEGREVYEQAKMLPDILNNVLEVTSHDVPKGKVRITTSNDIAHSYLLPVLNDLSQRYPEIQIDLIISDEKLDLIRENIDLAIRQIFRRIAL